jgi:DNA polymerase-3 subunit epsilon
LTGCVAARTCSVTLAIAYRRNDGGDERPRSWYVDVDNRETELTFLRREIYQREDVDIVSHEVSSLDRFADRI